MSKHKRYLLGLLHDIANPLTSLSFLLSQLEKEEKNDRFADVEKIKFINSQLIDLVSQIKLEINLRQANRSFTMSQLTDCCLSMLNRSMHNKSIQITQQHTKRRLRADYLVYYRILYNLLSNSVTALSKTNKSNKSINICSDIDSRDNFILKVYDNGPGISKLQKNHICEFGFSEGENMINFGMGLYIVCECVKKLGGKLDIDSVLGKYSEFTITIPRLHKNEKSYTGSTKKPMY